MPSCLFDAVVVPDGEASTEALCALGHAVEFVKDQYRHCKTLLAVGAGQALLEKAALPLDADDAALIVSPAGELRSGTKALLAGLAKHRNWDRALDPPPV
jgi:catalase